MRVLMPIRCCRARRRFASVGVHGSVGRYLMRSNMNVNWTRSSPAAHTPPDSDLLPMVAPLSDLQSSGSLPVFRTGGFDGAPQDQTVSAHSSPNGNSFGPKRKCRTRRGRVPVVLEEACKSNGFMKRAPPRGT